MKGELSCKKIVFYMFEKGTGHAWTRELDLENCEVLNFSIQTEFKDGREFIDIKIERVTEQSRMVEAQKNWFRF